jgi:hypothetical protein
MTHSKPLLALGVVAALATPTVAARGRASPPRSATVVVDLDRTLNTFSPASAIGAGVDGHGRGEIAQIYTPANLRAMRRAGLSPLTYRLRTELAAEAWHWNPNGRFSDAAHQQGYWASSIAGPGASVSYGYRLPRRGDTHDQANDDGYSRLDDGDPHSFWKSDPYLDSHYTHEADALHPQWALVDLGHHMPVNALRVAWGTPYATRFAVQFWVGPSAVIQNGHPLGHWADFPRGRFGGRGGVQTLRVATRPIAVRFVRVVLERSSHTAPRGARDIRDRLGYAIRELYLGRLVGGRLVDLVHHRRDASQTVTYASSTDPWHRASDRDTGVEQPSFTRVARSGLTAGQPLLVPVSVLYGTPQNAVAEIRYLIAHRIPIRGVELGEEADGQLASPEDYGALYVQFAAALHRAFPHLALGGPSFQTSIPDWYAWPDASGNRSWTNRFVNYLRGHGALGELSFFSFEWYPFDNTCAAPGPQLARASTTLASVVALQRAHGIPPTIPTYISEYGYSAFSARSEVGLAGALLNADTVGQFLALGGTTAYLYGYEPDALMTEGKCAGSWGNLTLLLADANHRVRQPLATFWGARLETQQWAQPGSGSHALLASTVQFADGADPQLLGAYAIRRPDGRVALLLVNKDPLHTVSLRVVLAHAAGATSAGGRADLFQLSSRDYVWHANGARGHARPDAPPRHSVVDGGPVSLPPFSLSVLRVGG